MFRMVQKLKQVKMKLMGFHRSHFSNIDGRIQEIQDSLAQVRCKILEELVEAQWHE